MTIALAESALLPDSLIRFGIRRLCRERLRQEYRGDWQARKQARFRQWREAPLAIATREANEQHYELPPGFFELCLGRRLKYSSAYYPTGRETLDQAEEAMLALYVERGELADGQDILELGCGWGSLSLYLAERFPRARITAVSNSAPQRQFIEGRCAARGIANLRVLTCDINALELPAAGYDRVVSIEMFEHCRNHAVLFERIANWLRKEGRLFVHVFCHRELAYPFDVDGDRDWMARYFFTGGQMPAYDSFRGLDQHLLQVADWPVDGTHYQRTANHWLANMDRRREQILRVFADTYGRDACRWFQRWRMFYMACAELFGLDGGRQWLVGHYRFEKR